jgi:hypothetical protein
MQKINFPSVSTIEYIINVFEKALKNNTQYEFELHFFLHCIITNLLQQLEHDFPWFYMM